MPGTKLALFVPGFMGTELWEHEQPPGEAPSRTRSLLWANISGIVRGTIYHRMRWPDAPGKRVLPGSFVRVAQDLGYGVLYEYVTRVSELPAGWTFRLWTYDWRGPIRQTAQALASQLADATNVADSVVLVGHSLGGALCMATYRCLKEMHAEAIIDKVITVGGVVWGSYSTCCAWRLEEDSGNQLALAPSILAGNFPFPSPYRTLARNGEFFTTIMDTFASWPVTYDMLPDPARGDDPGDGQRGLAHDNRNWQDALVIPSQGELFRSNREYHSWAHDPAGFPPVGKLMHVVGLGQRTPWRMDAPRDPSPGPGMGGPPLAYRTPQARAHLPGLSYTNNGDNRLTAEQQSIPGYYQLQVRGEHAVLQNHPYFLRNFWRLVRDPIPTDRPFNAVDVPYYFPDRVIRVPANWEVVQSISGRIPSVQQAPTVIYDRNQQVIPQRGEVIAVE